MVTRKHEAEHYWLAHPHESVVVFYLPLPDPMPLPDQEIFGNYDMLDRHTYRLMEASGLNFCAMHSGIGHSEAYEVDLDEISEMYRFSTLSSSLMFHSVKADLFANTGFDAALAALNATLMYALEDERPQLSTVGRDPVDPDAVVLPEPAELSLGIVSVVEAVVPLRLLDAQDLKLRNELIDISYPLNLDQYRQYEQATQQNFALRLNMALSAAIKDIQRYQRGYHAVRADAITLLTRQRLPLFVPFYVRTLAAEQQADGLKTRNLAQVKVYDRSLMMPAVLNKNEVAEISGGVQHVNADSAFVRNLDVYREAKNALKRDGDTRIAAMLTGIAAETLLDELLLSLMWEERITPEKAAERWGGTITSRVKKEFQNRLGGRWNLKSAGEVKNWGNDIAYLRNRVAHSAYVPSFEEATLALSRLGELIRFLVDLLLQNRSLQRYPRTAWMLAGERGFVSRDVVSEDLEDLKADPNETIWYETFSRWRETFIRCRRDQQSARVPSSDTSVLVMVLFSDNKIKWCQQDPEQRQARAVEVDVGAMGSAQRTALEELVNKCQHVRDPISSEFEHDSMLPITPLGDWKEDYHFLPIHNVMVDRSDLDGWDL